jgi:2',3'-cyclic-nucleotide 2'-phosphodiesterase (5'-nucleotidase family)
MATKRSVGATLTTSLTDIYEVPANKRAEWILVYITNTSGSTETFTVTYYDASQTASLPVLSGYTLSAKEFFQIGGQYNEFIMMEAGDKIQASASSSATILISVIEHNATAVRGE